MSNQSKSSEMENKDNIELFNLYIEDRLSENDKKEFEDRLAADKDFRTDFRVFLLTVIESSRNLVRIISNLEPLSEISMSQLFFLL